MNDNTLLTGAPPNPRSSIAIGSIMVPLNILHVLRTPVGGLFRHVLDLARGQAERGHRIGIICDSATGGPEAYAALSAAANRSGIS